jgi:hypothetical protein
LRKSSKFIIAPVVVLTIANVVLAFLGQDMLTICLISGAVVYLIVTLLYFDLNFRNLNIMSAIIFVGTMVYFILQLGKILQ